jgi:hypothetical protein
MVKDESIMAVIATLRSQFGDAIDVVDHWDTDLLAVGITRRGEPEPLVYVSAILDQERIFDLALELPPQPGSELPYEDGGWRLGLALAEVADVVGVHLGLS